MRTFYLITVDGAAKAKIKIDSQSYPTQGASLEKVLPRYFLQEKWKLVTKEEYDTFRPLVD